MIFRARPPGPNEKVSQKDQFLKDNQPGVYLTVPTDSAQAPDDAKSEASVLSDLTASDASKNTEQSMHLTTRSDDGANNNRVSFSEVHSCIPSFSLFIHLFIYISIKTIHKTHTKQYGVH